MEAQILPQSPLLPPPRSLHPQGGSRLGAQAIPVPLSSISVPPEVKGGKSRGQIAAALGSSSHPRGRTPILSCCACCPAGVGGGQGWGKRGAEGVPWLLTLALSIHE